MFVKSLLKKNIVLRIYQELYLGWEFLLQIQEKVTAAEQKLEEIRFLVSDNEQYEMTLDVVRDILSKVKELENK